MLDILTDSFFDSLKMLPFIFLTYVIIEVLERKANFAKNGKFLTGKAAPVLGSLAGAFPQCGISVMSAKLYEKNLIGIGTLLSVFIATSDEAFSILISSDKRIYLIPLLLIKIVLAIIVGEIVNALFGKKRKSRMKLLNTRTSALTATTTAPRTMTAVNTSGSKGISSFL